MKTHNFPSPPLDFILQQDSVSKISAPAKTTLCSSGDSCQHLIILYEGRVKVYYPATDGRSITLYHIGVNESCILTASCIVNDMQFPAIAETETDVKGYAVPADKVQKWMQTELQWQHYLFGLLSQRMASLIELVNGLAFKRLDNRLADYLLQQFKLENTSQLYTTHQLIADELASSREVISRLLKEFEREQFITLGRGYIKLLALEKLQNITIENH
ncbi:MAG: helix-turn-helix domain-containing protein [Methyloprofundus sp.]|nr:helix-turn-helix domain-containing protein [Methyloprofundus sp.]